MPYWNMRDPESFSAEQPFSLVDERIQILLREGHHRPASEKPFKWRFVGGPMMDQH